MDYYPEPNYELSEPPIPEMIQYSDDMPTIPVDPNDLAHSVCSKLAEYGNVIPRKTSLMVQQMCRVFNECIRLNAPILRAKRYHFKNNSQKIEALAPTVEYPNEKQTLVLSPKTGSAKSLTAKLYVSKLTNKTTLIVVPKVSDSIQFCRDINEWSGNPNYARCTYALSDTNHNSPLRIEKNIINDYRCVVLTHMMFKLANDGNNELTKALLEQRRDLIIIDERIALCKKFQINEKEIVDLANLVDTLIQHRHTNLAPLKDGLILLHNFMIKLTEEAKSSADDTLFLSAKKLALTIFPKKEDLDFTAFLNTISDPLLNISAIASSLLPTRSSRNNDIIREKITELSHKILNLLGNSLLFNISGEIKSFLFTENIVNQFGSCIVLDATASVNKIYGTSLYHQSDLIKYVYTEDPRRYDSLTLYKAIGYSQGQSSIFGNLNTTLEKEACAQDYLAIATNLLTPNDKLLIIAHKDFKEILVESYNRESMGNIVFTHWGNHIGKNDWSDCNKVMIIGWNYIPKIEQKINFINAVGEFEQASKEYSYEIYKEFLVTQLADDLIQAIMRCAARKTASEEGDCIQSEVYIFYPNTLIGHSVIEIVEQEFDNLTVVNWEPSKQRTLSLRVRGATSQIHTLMTLLKIKAGSGVIDISISDLIRESGIEKSYVYKLIKKEYFQEQLEENGYLCQKGYIYLSQ